MIDLESTIRTSSTSETLARITSLAWKQFGITRLANITCLDNIGISVYVSIRPNSKSLSVSPRRCY
jgi:ribosomal protein S12 methylthiotransferase accessory factor YcaO